MAELLSRAHANSRRQRMHGSGVHPLANAIGMDPGRAVRNFPALKSSIRSVTSHDAAPPHHAAGGGFRNPWPGRPGHGLGALLRWMFERARRGRLGFHVRGAPPESATPELRLPRAGRDECRVTWVGHSTFLLQIGALNILTDPVWADRASPVSWAGPERLVPPGLSLAALPPVDIVLQSHDHYDHLDDSTVRAIALRDPEATWCAPLGVARLLRKRGVREVVERDWHGDVTVGDAHITCVPARHFAGRSLAGRNATLWCGWVLGVAGRRVYFVGDTGYHSDFGEIARRYGPFDVVLMPVGAYDPRWFMGPVHVDPEEAVSAFTALRNSCPAERSVMVAMHWGTFALTDESIDEPPHRVRAEWEARGLPANDLWVLAPGETRAL